jgi:hypothetical protein
MSGVVDGNRGAMAAKILGGILAASSIALGGAAVAETGRKQDSSQAGPTDPVPRATAAQVPSRAQEQKDPCAPTFREWLAATRTVLRSYPDAVRERATAPPLGFSEALTLENARCASRDPVSLSSYRLRPRPDGG